MEATANKNLWKIIIGGTIGNLTEWYNFLLYGYLATVLSQVFFPLKNALTSLTLTFTLFAISFLVRPIGGILFGWIGDRFGRKRALLTSLILMGVPTLIIGCLPGYAQWGLLSSILLCLCRICQGLSTGGEHTGSAVYMDEYAPSNQRGLWVSTVPASAALGLLISSLISLLLIHSFTPEALLSWGWRVGYWLGACMSGVSIVFRLMMPETPSYQKIINHHQNERYALSNLFKKTRHLKSMAFVFLLASSWGIIYQLLYVWMPTYLTQMLHYQTQSALLINTIFLFIFLCLILCFGYLADRVSRQKLLMVSSTSIMVFAYPAFILLSSQSLYQAMIAMALLTLMFSIYIPSALVSMVEAFDTELRYTGLSFSFNMGLALFGGTCPLIATWLITHTQTNLAPAAYMAFAGLMALLTTFSRFL
jgi:MHS family proline/betaine transporter-like MFS transporter